MSPLSYRQRRKRRLRIVAAILALSLAAQPIVVTIAALKGFGAGVTALLLAVALVVGYRALARRRPPGNRP